MTATEDRELRRALHSTLGSVQPPPVPIDAITRRGKGIRLRRAGAAVGAVGLAGVIVVASLALRGSQPAVPPAAPAITAGPDGVFASGTADGHPWRLAIQDIADPGYPCLPGITINGADADWVYPDPGSRAAVGLGPVLPGFGFGFIQLPADINGVVVNGRHRVAAVTVTACGDRYHIVGFAYSLAEPLQVTVTNPPPGWSRVITMPVVSTQPPGPATSPDSPGLWINLDSAGREGAFQTLASGARPGGQTWIIQVQLGTGGECYQFDAPSSLGNAQMGECGPVSTPDGPEIIMALPLGFPSGTAATGYVIQVSPRTARVKAVLSNGSSELAAMQVVNGRKYAAFIVSDPLRLSRLIWLDARGRVITTTTAVPRYGYVQLHP